MTAMYIPHRGSLSEIRDLLLDEQRYAWRICMETADLVGRPISTERDVRVSAHAIGWTGTN